MSDMLAYYNKASTQYNYDIDYAIDMFSYEV